MRTIEGFDCFFDPVDILISQSFIPALFNLNIPLDDLRRSIISHKPNEGGLGVPLLKEDAEKQHKSSKIVTRVHVESILDQSMIMKETDKDGNTVQELKKTDRSNQINKFCKIQSTPFQKI